MVTRVTPDSVYIGEERIDARTVFWAAGNAASPLVRTMGIPVDRIGRALVAPNLSVPDHPDVFVVGDAAAAAVADPHGAAQDPAKPAAICGWPRGRREPNG